MKSPLAWPGGKYLMQKKILPLIAEIPHTTFAEVFGGAAHITFEKTPSKVDIYNDLDQGLTDFFRLLRSDKGDALIKQLTLTPYSRSEFESCKNWKSVSDPVERVRQWFVVSQQSFNNLRENWAYSGRTSTRHMSKAVSGWLRRVDEHLPTVVDRLRELQIENLDFQPFIEKYDSPDTLFYLDPAYVPVTRIRKQTYAHEMTEVDHVRLVDVLIKIQGNAILSGYDNTLYNRLNWDKVTIGEFNRSMGYRNNSKKEEWLWLKY